LFSYLDTQLIRLGGPNFHELPINRSVAPVHNNQRDGYMRHTVNTAQTSYQPNSLGGGCPFQAGTMNGGYHTFGERIDAQKIRERSDSFRDHFSQATLFWNSQSPAEQEHIVRAFRFELGKVLAVHVRQHVVDLLTNVDLGLARRVAEGIGAEVSSSGRAAADAIKRLEADWDTFGVTSRPGKVRKQAIERSEALSMAHTIKDTAKSRKVAILATNGVDGEQLDTVKATLTAAGAVPVLVSPLPILKTTSGKQLQTEKLLLTAGSVNFDAVFVPGGKDSATALRADADVLHFVQEAFKHCKALGASGEGADVLLAANIAPPSTNGTTNGHGTAALTSLGSVFVEPKPSDLKALATEFVQAVAQHRDFSREESKQAERVPA
jgi:catalase